MSKQKNEQNKAENPHDRLFKATFSIAAEAKAFIKKFMPKWISEGINFETFGKMDGSFITEELDETLSDIIYEAKWKGTEKAIKVSFLYEHKSQGKPLDVFQLKGYLDRVYERQQRNKEAFHVLIPMVVHHDKTIWKMRTFADLFDLPDKRLGKYIPYFGYEVLDLYRIADSVLENIPESVFLQPAFLMFKHKGEGDFIKQHVADIFLFAENLEVEIDLKKFFINAFLNYIFSTNKFSIEEMSDEILKKLPKMAYDYSGTTYGDILEKGEKIGLIKGEQKGLAKGEKRLALTKYEYIMHSFMEFKDWSLKKIATFNKVEEKKLQKLKLILAYPSKDKMQKGIIALFFKDIELEAADLKRIFTLADNYRKQVKNN